ncbi:MAG: hypothetical protein ACFCU4_05065 [Puniceicoccaceae bacterium]
MKNLLVLPLLASALCASPFVVINDFETDISGILPVYAPGEDTSNTVIFRVENGGPTFDDGFIPGNIPGAGGSASYLELDMLAFDSSDNFVGVIQGPRVQWNVPTGVLPFISGQGHRVSIYLDDANNGDSEGSYYPAGSAIFWQPGMMGASTTARVAAGGFGIRTIDVDPTANVDLRWFATADGDAIGYNDASAAIQSTELSKGWYTFETRWVDDLNGMVDEINRIFDDSGNLVATYIRSSIIPVSFVGGLGNVSVGGGTDEIGGPVSLLTLIGIDRPTLIVPEASTTILVLLGAIPLLTRRRQSLHL